MSDTDPHIHHVLSSYWLKVVIWSIPVVFGAGGIYASIAHSSSDLSSVKADLTQVKKDVSDHTKAGVGHEATRSRLDRIETGQIRIISRQQVQSENIAAICQATNARCK